MFVHFGNDTLTRDSQLANAKLETVSHISNSAKLMFVQLAKAYWFITEHRENTPELMDISPTHARNAELPIVSHNGKSRVDSIIHP